MQVNVCVCVCLHAQCVFLLWCMAPVSWNGSQLIYTRLVRPFFLQHEATLDSVVKNLSGKARSAAQSAAAEGTHHTQRLH